MAHRCSTSKLETHILARAALEHDISVEKALEGCVRRVAYTELSHLLEFGPILCARGRYTGRVLPIYAALPELRLALEQNSVVLLEAPPGAGKSTVLPLELLGESWLDGQKIIVLQPRRVAARAVASRMADSLGQKVGQTVGYRVRFDSSVSGETRIEVVTEGVLTRQLQRDPSLEGVGLIVLDEFHERSLNADLAYVLCREVQGALREDLRLLVMSATLEPELLGKLKAPLVRSEGRPYPVEVRYSSTDPLEKALPETVARAVELALENHAGDVLAFLPGVSEILRAQRWLEARGLGVKILLLYGDLPLERQREALLPDPNGMKRVVLSTSIAETSVTLNGVRTVVDSGYSRVSQFDPSSGLSRLVTVRVSQDAATQRAGRAGREAPGVCYRLWSERTHGLLLERRPPEILEADLAPLCLELAGWGTKPDALEWPDPPPVRAVNTAQNLLESLDAFEDGKITARGRRMLELPTHPRISHLLLEGDRLGLGALACDVAALLEERDPRERGSGADLTARVDLLRQFRSGRAGSSLERIERLAAQWRRLLKVSPDNLRVEAESVGRLVALAYPERVAQRRGSELYRYRLASGKGVKLLEDDPLAGCEFLAVAHLDFGVEEGRIYLAAPLEKSVLETRWKEVLRWDKSTGTLNAREDLKYLELTLDSRPLREVSKEARTRALIGAVRQEGLGLLNWTDAAQELRARVGSLRVWRPEDDWPDFSDTGLLASLEEWLGPALEQVRKRDDFAKLDVYGLLKSLLPWKLTALLEELAPTHLTVPSGHRIRLEYALDGSAPVLAVKLQEMFGQAETPTVGGGRVPVVLHLLSPARRPVQVTQDLKSFWNSGYLQVRKELRGDYPRHPWPEDPWNAPPTRATTRGMKREG